MKANLILDRYVWRFIVPRLRPDTFRYKIVSAAALAYIAIFRRPRKFLLHFLSGKGTPMEIDTWELVENNPMVHHKIFQEIFHQGRQVTGKGSIQVNQLLVTHPDFKYSVGSLTMDYAIDRRNITLTAFSRYNFGRDTERITMHLHNRMHELEERGKAKSFDIKGNLALRQINELYKPVSKNEANRFAYLNRLYV